MHGNPYSVDSCNGLLKDTRLKFDFKDINTVGQSQYMTDGQDWDADEGMMYSMGSYAVMPGCTLYLYKDYYWTGTTYVNHIF